MKKLVVVLNRHQYERLLELLLEMPPRDLAATKYGASELYAFDVTNIGTIEQNLIGGW